jgi:protein O-mannosyl-transferase
MTAEDHYYAGLDLFGAGKLEEAIAEYRSALSLDPKFTDALHGLAQAYFAKNDFDSAVGVLQQILELDPEDVLAWTTISRAYQRRGMITEAEHAANKARIHAGKERLPGQKKEGV